MEAAQIPAAQSLSSPFGPLAGLECYHKEKCGES